MGTATLGEAQQTRRAVKLEAALAVSPAGSLLKQLLSWGKLPTASRLVSETDVTQRVSRLPHWHST